MTSGENPHSPKVWLTTLFLFVGAGLVFAQTAPLRLHELQLADRGEQKIVSVRFSQPPTSITSFALDAPPRVVIDVKGPIERLASTSYPAQDRLVKQVRLGFHQGYVRFVLDLKGGAVPPFSAQQDQNLVTVTLGRQTQPIENTKSHLIFSRDKRDKKAASAQIPAQQTARDLPEKSTAKLQRATSAEPASLSIPSPSLSSRPSVARTKSYARPRLLLPGVFSANPSPRSRAVQPKYSLLRAAKESQLRQTRSAPSPVSKRNEAAEKAQKTEAAQAAAAMAKSRIPAPPPPSLSSSQMSSPMSSQAETQKEETQKRTGSNALPRQARRHLGKGQILYDQGKVDEAIAEWRETARLTPNNPKVHHLLGLALQDRGDLAEAVAELKTTLRFDPNNATAYVHLAQALEAQGEVQAAHDAYKKAVKLVPTSAHVHNRLGHLLAAQGDWQAAAQEWQKTTDLQPDYAYAYANLGEALERIERKKEALAAYREAVSRDPQAPFADEVRQRITRLSAYGF